MIRALLTLLGVVLALPVVGVLAAWAVVDAAAWANLSHLAHTVLPGYLGQTAILALGVALGVTLVGAGAAAAVTLFEFPGRRQFEWLLLLPLAMPAYVLAYSYTDLLQFSGPLQSGLRAAWGLQGAMWPDVRSLPGAIVLFVLCLYPYVYLLTRTALTERGVQMMEAARMLGAGLGRRVLEVALPLARPAMAAGVALALMETMADFGVGSYFGLTTLSTGIYKAWLVMDDRIAAALLSSVLLLLVALLLWVERHARRRLHYASARAGGPAVDAQRARLQGLSATTAWALCAAPVALGFVVPVAWLLRLVWVEARHGDFGLPWTRFAHWSVQSLLYALAAAALTVGFALALSSAQRTAAPGQRGLRLVKSLVSLGYAVPGLVIAVGILLPLGTLQAWMPGVPWGAWVTGTSLALMFAYVVRFSAVALQSLDAGYERLPRSLDDTARTLGTSPKQILWRVHGPLLKRSMAAAALLVFVDVMKELPATLVLRPFNHDTLAVVAYNLARDERLAEAALPSLAIVAVGLLPVIFLSHVLRNGGHQRHAKRSS